ncbi:MAG: AzlC family ABC transporter permease [Dichotomicrobium sp.]
MCDDRSAWRQFRLGATAILPICIGATPIALVYGALASERGLSLLEICLMSATVFAGASQFVAIGLWSSPLPAGAIVFATFMVNLRHVMMSASLARRMGAFGPAQRYAAFFGLTDEIWALAEARALNADLTPAYFAGLAVPLYLCWNAGTLAGGVFGRGIGDPETFGLDFVFAAMFIALVVGFRQLPAWLPVVVTSAAVSVLTYQVLPAPWYVIVGGLSAVALAAILAPSAPRETVEA